MTLVIDGRTVQRVVLLDREPDEPKTAALADEVRVGAVISRYLADPLVDAPEARGVVGGLSSW